jgi:hypothetical protein
MEKVCHGCRVLRWNFTVLSPQPVEITGLAPGTLVERIQGVLYPAGLAYRSALAAALLLLPSCIIVVDEDPDDPPSDTSAVIVTDVCPGDPSYVDGAEVVGDRLVVTASYGGCGSTQVWACWDGVFLESNPVQVPIAIHNEPAGDCDALFTDTISVSLEPVLDGYIDAYGGADTIILRVGEFSPTWTP